MEKENISIQILALHEKGWSIRQIARQVGLSKSHVGRVVKSAPATGLSTTSTTTSTVGTVGAKGPETAAKGPKPASGTAVKNVSGSLGTTTRDNDRHLQAGKELKEVVSAYNQRLQAHIAFFNQEVNEFLGELLLISTVGYVVPLGLLSRYHQKVQRLLKQGASLYWELGFDYREYRHWSSFSILNHYLTEHVFKASVRHRQTDLIDFRLEAYVQKEAEEVKARGFFSS